MADNAPFTPGSGAMGATDEIGGVHYPRVKLSLGADGAAVDAIAGAGVTNAGTQRVTIATNDQVNTNLAALAAMGRSVSVTITRPNDSTAYAVGDVIGPATGSTAGQTFTSIGPAGASMMIVGTELLIESSALIANETSYRLYLYNVLPPSALGDNAAFDLPAGDRASFLGYLDLGTPVDLGSTLYVANEQVNKLIKLAGVDLFAYLVTIGGHTPAAQRVYKITLHAVVV